MPAKEDLRELIRGIDSRLASVEDKTGLRIKQRGVEEETHRYLLVGSGEMSIGIDIGSMVEVGELPQVTFLPNLPPWILGIMNIRSEIVSVIDFPAFLNLSAATGDRMVVIGYKELRVGFRVNTIYGSVVRPESGLKSLDFDAAEDIDTSLFRAGLIEGDRLHYLLDVRRLLTSEKLRNYNRSDL